MPHFTGNYSSWWNSQDQQISQTLSKNINFRVENSPQHCQEVEHLGLQLQDKGSPSTQSSSQSIHDLTGAGTATSQDLCVSPSQPVQTQIFRKHVEGQVKPTLLLSNPEFSVSTSEMDLNQSTISFAAYSDPYFSGLFNGYGPQAIIQSQMVGMAPTRIPLPPDLAQDGPIYVNARQYRGILRRRQIRAKLEAQNKLVKNRKPYLHESRHLHAVNRVRGSGGRFLSKKQQEHKPVDAARTSSNGSESASVLSHQGRNVPGHEEEDKQPYGNEHDASSSAATTTTTTTTNSMSIGNTNGNLNLIFQHHPAISSQMALSMSTGVGGFSGNERRHGTASSFR